MIPIKDNVPRVLTPFTMWLIIILNLASFTFEMLLHPQSRLALFHLFGVVPARYFFPDWAATTGYPIGTALPFFSYMFLHSGWMHLILNLWMLWIFADNVEDATGHVRFMFFYLLCGLAASCVQLLLSHSSNVPIIGASGAVAGVMGAYFVLYPHARVLTLFPIIIIPYFINLPASLFLAVWFLLQLFSGIFDKISGGAQSVAWGAHIGGFITGAILIRLFVRKDRCKYCYVAESKNYELPEDF